MVHYLIDEPALKARIFQVKINPEPSLMERTDVTLRSETKSNIF